MEEVNKKISQLDFNPDKYVKDVSQICIGGLELQKHKAKIQLMSDETNQALKKNVYKNYMQFIETAREISHLEGEMYQLSHLLTEQRALLVSMGSGSVTTTKINEDSTSESNQSDIEDKEKEKLVKLIEIMEKVENCINLCDGTQRELIFEGDIVELDTLESTAIHRCHAFLFTDILIITVWISNRRGPAKYKFEASYELGSLAVVNVRDLGTIKYAFKLLVFPDTRLFQCANNQSKVDWLDKLEKTKKERLSTEKKKPEKMSSMNSRESQDHQSIRTDSLDSDMNPFAFDDDEETLKEVVPEWVIDSPEDIDVFIVQRHFEDAYDLIQKTKFYLEKNPHISISPDFSNKIESRIISLIQVLLHELSCSPEKSLQGDLRAHRRAVRLLNQLGKSNEACDLYLKLCTSLLKTQAKQVKRDGATTAYARRAASIFLYNLAAITTEFQQKAFPNSLQCYSAFVLWSSVEVSHFTSHLIKQIFVPQSSLRTLAECVNIVRSQCDSLCGLGLELTYQFDGLLLTPMTRALVDTKDKLVEAVRMRCAEDTWKPSEHSKAALIKLNAEFATLELPPLDNYTTGDSWLELTSNTLAFIRLFNSLLDDCLLLSMSELEFTIGKALYDVFDSQLRHVAASLKVDRLQPQKALMQKNAIFLFEYFFKSCSNRYKNKTGYTCKQLDQLRNEYASMLKEVTVNVTGYI